jgi:acetolactate synthase-1/2/3 large subunit
VNELLPQLRELGVPLMTTWNGADRLGTEEPLYMGRPNTWGQRSANVLLQQADVVVALGSRLGLQQTGFNWQQFVPAGKVVQVEIDRAELDKGHPRVDLPIRADANEVLRHVAGLELPGREEWVAFCRRVRELIPLDEPGINTTGDGYIAPYRFAAGLSAATTAEDVVIPCSSGGANSVMMQAFEQKHGQLVITDKGLASMGYGLAGSIGAALAHRDRRTILVEGDGGFAQNLQEIATAAVNGLNLKIFIFANEGYASIRSTQRNYFGGEYVGCDVRTGLGFPDWTALFNAYGVPAHELDAATFPEDPRFQELFDASGPAAFIVPIDPEQSYLPKISSRVTESGSMESNPLHLMSPDLPEEIAREVYRFVEAP